MSEFITPVFDRTQLDVTLAMNTLLNWRNNVSSLDMLELKGCLNISDLNRIENNTTYLAELLTTLSYPVTVEAKEWVMEDLLDYTNIYRIINNIRKLITAFYSPQIEDLPNSLLNYEQVNIVEKYLFEINELILILLNSSAVSGTFNSGSRRTLPLRRL